MDDQSTTPPGSIFDATPYLRLFLDKDGRLFQNGKEIIHVGIYRQFVAAIENTNDGGYQVRMGNQICRVEVEDAPFVVKGIREDAGGRLILELNDGAEELLDPASFTIGRENVPYCTVKGGVFPARFSRPAYYQIAQHIESGEDESIFFLLVGGSRICVQRKVDGTGCKP